MLLPLDDLAAGPLLDELAEQYGETSRELAFVPLGEDSWCYRLGDLWVSVRRDLRGHFPIAYETAYRLRQAGLDFVLAPLAGADGKVVRQVAGLPVVVFPFLQVTPVSRETLRPGELESIVDRLGRVHASDPGLELDSEDYTLSFDDDLTLVLSLAESPARPHGPFGERIHRHLSKHSPGILSDRAELAKLAEICAATQGTLSLTHGEPLNTNILRSPEGLLIADWGDAMLGPPERDWCHVIRTLGAQPVWRPDFMRFYELRWRLSEIAEYAMRFFGPHAGDAEDQAMWQRLLWYLPESPG